MAFVENRGQADAEVRYYARGDRYGFYFTDRSIVLAFLPEQGGRRTAPRDGVVASLQFVGANAHARIDGAQVSGTVNYLHGSDPSGWQTGVRRYSELTYHDLWPGVDLHVGDHAGILKYEFHVAAGANAEAIKLAYTGVSSQAVDASGALALQTALGTLRDARPVSYQVIDGARVPVDSAYALEAKDPVANGIQGHGFSLGSYRHDRELVVDPGIEYSTFLGGASHEIAAGVVVDAAGSVYVVGTTQSPDFPTTAGAFRRTGAAGNFSDVFVSKINATGTALIYSTFIGGSDLDFGRRIAVDVVGNAYITGQTKSTNFPTTGGAFDRSFNVLNCPRCGIDQYDAFVAKLNPSGSALVYSTFLGGTDFDDARGIAVDDAGSAYVTGETLSPDFPTTAGAFARTNRGAYDVFVTKLNATGSALAYSTLLGGTNVDNGERIAVDAGGQAFVLGFSSSTDFPTTPGALKVTTNGGFDITLTKLNAAGNGLIYSTYLGGSDAEFAGGLAVDAAGNAYVSGTTASTNFPTTASAVDRTPQGGDAFVSKVNPAGSALIYSTLLGGTASDGATAVQPDAAGNAWVTGITSSADFPVTPDAAPTGFHGVADAFVTEVNAQGSALLYSTYLGGTQSDGADDAALEEGIGLYVAGHTYSLDFPATAGAYDTVFNGDPSIFWGDAFVAKLSFSLSTSEPPASAPIPVAPVLLSPTNGQSATQPLTFDWNDATGAATYNIQVDDSSAFTAPLVREATVATSMYATSGLATVPHFWRVRGVNVNGVVGAWSAVRTFTPQAAPPPATLSTMSTNPATVAGGSASSGTVVLSVGAPEGGAVVTLSSSAPAIASVPATVTVAANGFAGTFAIATTTVTASTSVVITASYNGSVRTTSLTVTPASAPPSVSLQGITLSPSNVVGGASAVGVVTLSAAAPAGGLLVALSSSSPAIGSVPGSVVVPSGATAASFSVNTSNVTTTTVVTVTAGANSVSRTASLTVSPSAAQTATLSVTASGRKGVVVSSQPAGISVTTGSSGSASFTVGASITLTLSDGRDAIWSGACSTASKAKTCAFKLTGAASVVAAVQ